MSKRTLSHFSNPKQPLFDADLYEFAFGDSLGYAAPRKHRSALATCVRATFSSFDGTILHKLAYSNVVALNASLPSVRWFKWSFGRDCIGSLLANELTAVNATQMQHSFLFTSGAVISLTFGRVTWETRRNRPPVM